MLLLHLPSAVPPFPHPLCLDVVVMICRCPCCCNYVLLELHVAPIVYGVADYVVRAAVVVAPDDAASVVRPAVPIDASKAY